ncbi:MAG TPA: efflux RND transporter periplasmic adaptor subunit [Noviherbaspirillum sp.]|nr:efflux RND transporter periplasmic adaptor subunit [Noviherbaspirillum sp.]
MDSHTETKNVRSVKKASRRWALGVLGLAAAVLVGWYLFAPEPLVVEIAAVESGTLQVTVNNQGQVRVHDKYVVAAPVAAEIARIELHDGDPVAQGQEVATLSPLPMDERQRREAVARLDAAKALAREAALRAERAQTDMQFAINERARVERLVNDNFVSPQAVEKALTAERTSRAEWDAAKSRQQAAAADVKAAEAALLADERPSKSGKRELRLTAPVGGYVLKVHEKSERTINAGSPLVTIGDPTRYEVVVDVLSTDAVKIHAGDLMLLEGWGGGKSLRARVRLVEPVAFTKVSALGVEEQRVNIIADPVDPLGPLGDGYRIEARIVIWQGDKVTKLPASSLFRVGEEWHVFVVENGRAKERAVKVGQRNQDEAQILSGLAPGAQVIRYPSNQLSDGARVAAAG